MVTDILDIIGRNITAEEEGVWVQPFEQAEEVKFKIVGLTSSRAKAMLKKLSDKSKRKKSSEPAESQDAEFIAYGLLLDWSGMTFEGQDFPFSPDNALKLLKDPRMVDLRNIIYFAAQDRETFKQHILEEETKN